MELNKKEDNKYSDSTDGLANKEFDEAKINYQKALELAVNQNTREWYINQLKYNALKKD